MFASGTLRRHLALVALAERRLRENYLGRAASAYGWGIAASYALLVVIAPASAWALVAQALATASAIVGALAVGAALRDAWGKREQDALLALAQTTGFGGATVHAVRAVAAALRAAKAIGMPAIVLVALGLAASLARGKP